jgi:prepilin-type N-terminal cleavage/methylation domain-containing protein
MKLKEIHFNMHSKTCSNKRLLQKGLSIVEVLIAVSILSMIFIAASYATSISLSRSKYNQDRILASRYADELEEWLRGEKESEWSSFVAKSASSPGLTYCFNSTTISWPASGSCGSTFGLNNRFKREVVLSGTGTQVDVEVTVQWKDASRTYSVPVDTVFVLWD